ncbi:Two-component response regulator yesN [Streptococcus sp. ZB199]|nr:Two-component response regulator yesN [Streptococcus sp. ZB199]
MTGYDDFEFARKAIKLGADDYLLKPFSKDDIEEMLAKVKGKLDQERKKAQVEGLVSHGYSTDLEEAIHARLADSQLTLKDLAYQLGFSASYLSVLIKKKLGLPSKTTSFKSE